MWLLSLRPWETDEWDCGEAMLLLMGRLPSYSEIWSRLGQEFRVDLYVSLKMRSSSNGFSLSPEGMVYLSERGIEAGFDILRREEPGAERDAPPDIGSTTRLHTSSATEGTPSVI